MKKLLCLLSLIAGLAHGTLFVKQYETNDVLVASSASLDTAISQASAANAVLTNMIPAYGSIYIVSNSLAIATNYTTITNFSTVVTNSQAIPTNVTTHTTGITVRVAGTYHVFYQLSVQGTGAATLESTIFVDGVEQGQAEFVRRMSAGGDAGSGSAIGQLTLASNQTVYVRVKSSNAGPFTPVTGHLVVYRLGSAGPSGIDQATADARYSSITNIWVSNWKWLVEGDSNGMSNSPYASGSVYWETIKRWIPTLPVTVISTSGDTASNQLPRLITAAPTFFTTNTHDVVTIMLGANDVLLGVDVAYSNYVTLINSNFSLGADSVSVIGYYGYYSNATFHTLNERMRGYCESNNISFIDPRPMLNFNGVLSNSVKASYAASYPANTHLNTNGQFELAKVVFGGLLDGSRGTVIDATARANVDRITTASSLSRDFMGQDTYLLNTTIAAVPTLSGLYSYKVVNGSFIAQRPGLGVTNIALRLMMGYVADPSTNSIKISFGTRSASHTGSGVVTYTAVPDSRFNDTTISATNGWSASGTNTSFVVNFPINSYFKTNAFFFDMYFANPTNAGHVFSTNGLWIIEETAQLGQ